jgi:hypothetical protein
MKPIDIRLIQARRKKIQAEIDAIQAEFEKQIVALKAEAKELDIAERVFSRLSLNDADVSTNNNSKKSKQAPPDNGKPDGLPAVSEMIKEALAYAVIQGGYGLKPAGILAYVRGKWWPEAQSNDVGPIAWRMWQNDQIDKLQDGEYGLIDAERAAVRADFEKEAAKMPPPGPIVNSH